MKSKSNNVKAVVMNITAEGQYLLNEIKGLKVGSIIEGVYQPETGALDFKWNGLDAVLWIGKNAKVINDESYLCIKEKHPDSLILFRAGDFYVVKYQDAVEASKTLGITLIRNKEGVHQCEFPHYALDTYLPKLVRAGYRIAIVDLVIKHTCKKREVVETVSCNH